MLRTVEGDFFGERILKVRELTDGNTKTCLGHGLPRERDSIAFTGKIGSFDCTHRVHGVFHAGRQRLCLTGKKAWSEPIEPMKASGNQFPPMDTLCHAPPRR